MLETEACQWNRLIVKTFLVFWITNFLPLLVSKALVVWYGWRDEKKYCILYRKSECTIKKQTNQLKFSAFHSLDPRKCYFPWVGHSFIMLIVSSSTVPFVPAIQKFQKFLWKVRAIWTQHTSLILKLCGSLSQAVTLHHYVQGLGNARALCACSPVNTDMDYFAVRSFEVFQNC